MTEPYEQILGDLGISGFLYPMALMTIASLLSFKTHLVRQKVVFNLKKQTATASYLFFIGKRETEFHNLFYDYIILSGAHAGGWQPRLYFLSEEIKRKISGKTSTIHCIMFSEYDDHFYPDLQDYMSYKFLRIMQRK